MILAFAVTGIGRSHSFRREPCRMRSTGPIRFAFVLAALLLRPDPIAAQIINILHSFTGGPNDGQNPGGAFTVSGSTFFGTTSGGGNVNDGAVFKMNLDGSGYGLLHSFTGSLTDGAIPYGSLEIAGTSLFGFSLGGGSASNGVVFKLNSDGTAFGLPHSFTGTSSDGAGPLGSPIQSGGLLYGMTSQGGTGNKGTVFRMNLDGTGFAVLHSFGGPDGQDPSYSKLLFSGNKLYGMTASGGANGAGCVFSLNADGTNFQVFHSFNAATGDGWAPLGSLVLVGSTLYGTTSEGGGGAGTIFKINLDGTGYGILHTFTGASNDGADPRSDLTAIGNLLFGTTYFGGTANLGTVFEMNVDGTGFGLLHSFVGGSADGANPFGSPIAFNGSLYGMTVQGGAANDGVIYSIAVPESSSLVLLATAGAVALAARRRHQAVR
jgi:uncharacterized repeat protein (TIGR03803 family)